MDEARRLRGIGLAALATIAAATLWGWSSPDVRAGSRKSSDIVMMRCKVAGQRVTIQAREASAGTPSRKTDSCAQAVSDLMLEGFEVTDVAHSLDLDFVFYTLQR